MRRVLPAGLDCAALGGRAGALTLGTVVVASSGTRSVLGNNSVVHGTVSHVSELHVLRLDVLTLSHDFFFLV
jgi:hypothetical protein